jgi:nucleoside-diphosphate-sugar epimerase
MRSTTICLKATPQVIHISFCFWFSV